VIEPDSILHQLALGDCVAIGEVVKHAYASDDVVLIVAVAVFAHDTGLLSHAANLSATAAQRQLIAIASAHLAGEAQRVHDLARDHLAENPDSVLVAWISARSGQTERRETS